MVRRNDPEALAKQQLRRLERRFKDNEKIIGFFKDLRKLRKDWYGGSGSQYSAELSNLKVFWKLTDADQETVQQYINSLGIAEPITFSSYDGT